MRGFGHHHMADFDKLLVVQPVPHEHQTRFVLFCIRVWLVLVRVACPFWDVLVHGDIHISHELLAVEYIRFTSNSVFPEGERRVVLLPPGFKQDILLSELLNVTARTYRVLAIVFDTSQEPIFFRLQGQVALLAIVPVIARVLLVTGEQFKRREIRISFFAVNHLVRQLRLRLLLLRLAHRTVNFDHFYFSFPSIFSARVKRKRNLIVLKHTRLEGKRLTSKIGLNTVSSGAGIVPWLSSYTATSSSRLRRGKI